MGSAVPFQDLILSPSPKAALSTAGDGVAGTTVLKVPKVEPKLEPLEDSPHGMDSPDQLFSSSTSDFSNSQNDRLPSDNGNVYSEYRRITELFRTAFSQRLQERYDDVSVVDPDSRAIVPVNDEDAVSSVAVSHQGSRRFGQRSSELVRVNDLGLEAQRHFRDVVRRTRMIYDALRIVSVVGEQCGRRPRGDLRASSIMRDHGLWLNQDRRIVGSIPGIEIGDLFFFRMELCVLGLHGQIQAGIDYLPARRSSNREPIATSIIVSGGYEDDEDAGDTLIYTGQGGQGKLSKQCMPQKLEGGNLALERSMNYGIEIRVIRGFKYEGGVSSKIYVYDGLYKIVDCWSDVGKSGFGVYKYKLMRIDGQPQLGSSILRLAETLRIRPLSVRPRGYLSLDISNSKESVPVLLFNDIDNEHDPLCHDYLPKTVFPPYAFNLGSNGTGCECESGCNDGCLCAMKNGGEFAYDQNGLLMRGKPLIFECGAFCKCPPHCRNRVSQRGLRNRLEVFRSRETGWGVRSLDLIHAGAFICEYAGVVLTREQAQIFAMNGDILIYPNQFSNTWAEWGDLSQIYPDYVQPSYPSVPPLDFAMDVSRMRNVACYISQSSSPNVLVQFVLYDHNNLMFPHLMLFAMENIPPLRELSLDYGVAVEWTGKLTICN